MVAPAGAISVLEVLWNGKEFEARNLIVFLAFCVIFVTLVLQGLTLPALIRGLGLAGAEGGGPGGVGGRGAGRKAAIRDVEGERGRSSGPGTHIYDEPVHPYRPKMP